MTIKNKQGIEKNEVERRLNSPIGIIMTVIIAFPPATVTIFLIYKIITGDL